MSRDREENSVEHSVTECVDREGVSYLRDFHLSGDPNIVTVSRLCVSDEFFVSYFPPLTRLLRDYE